MIDTAKLKTLRHETGVSFSLCKKALDEGGNLEAAKKLLIKWGAEAQQDKSKKPTVNGIISVYVHHNKKVAAMIELFCETDFVSANPEFSKLGSELAMQIASMSATTSQELRAQEYIRDPKKKVEDLLKEAVLKFGENIKVGRITRWEI